MEKWKKAVEMVKEFYLAFEQGKYIKNVGIYDFNRYCLRLKLFVEEMEEYLEAENIYDKVGVLDALCDMYYIYIGTLLEMTGGDVREVTEQIYFGKSFMLESLWFRVNNNGFRSVFMDAFEEVHRSNMSKLGPDGKPIFREDGKIIKGPNYFPPDLKQFFEEEIE